MLIPILYALLTIGVGIVIEYASRVPVSNPNATLTAALQTVVSFITGMLVYGVVSVVILIGLIIQIEEKAIRKGLFNTLLLIIGVAFLVLLL